MERHYQSELTAEELLEVMFDYVAKISTEKDLDQLLLLMADMGKKLILADRCTLWLLDEGKKMLWTKVAHGLDRVEIPYHAGFVGHAVLTGESILVEDAYKDARFLPDVDRQTGYRTKAVLCIPIQNQEGTIIGAYQAINKMTLTSVFNEKDLKYLSLAASYSGKSLESAMLHNEIVETQKEIIFTMGEIGESRSEETGNHVRRVADYSKLLASLYGLTEEEADLIKLASPMHDIGKVAIPDSILMKPGKLTEAEFNLMKTHTTVGYKLFRHSHREILKTASIIAYHHHEKWNGKGYPQGLKGEDIHLYGRITAIADVFDALGSDRVYKKAWPLQEIIELFQKERGIHFDPVLVDLFLAHLDDFLAIKKNYSNSEA